MSKYYLGLDVHKVRSQCCLVDQEGRIVREGSLPTKDVASLVQLPGLQVPGRSFPVDTSAGGYYDNGDIRPGKTTQGVRLCVTT